MISLFQEASVDSWLALYVFLQLFSLVFLHGKANKAVQQKDTSSKAMLFIGLNIMVRTVLFPAITIYIVYKLICVGIPQEVSFLTLFKTYLVLMLPLFLISKVQVRVLKRRLATGESLSFFPALFVLLRIPFAIPQNITKWFFFAKIASTWFKSDFWTLVVALVFVVLYNSLEEVVVKICKSIVNVSKKPVKEQEKASEQ